MKAQQGKTFNKVNKIDQKPAVFPFRLQLPSLFWINEVFLTSLQFITETQYLHRKIPVCILICICCELLDPKVFPQSRHGNCRPETLLWLCLWFISDLPSGKSSPHTSHVTTLFLWDNMCRLRRALLWKVFAHLVHPYIFSLECSQLCFSNVRRSLHARPHNMHVLGGRFLPCFA